MKFTNEQWQLLVQATYEAALKHHNALKDGKKNRPLVPQKLKAGANVN